MSGVGGEKPGKNSSGTYPYRMPTSFLFFFLSFLFFFFLFFFFYPFKLGPRVVYWGFSCEQVLYPPSLPTARYIHWLCRIPFAIAALAFVLCVRSCLLLLAVTSMYLVPACSLPAPPVCRNCPPFKGIYFSLREGSIQV